MQRDDYESISKIIEEVIGKDTLTCVKLLQGIKYYFDNKVEDIQIIRSSGEVNNIKPISVYEWRKEADEAMKRYTAKLKEDAKEFKEEACSITGWE